LRFSRIAYDLKTFYKECNIRGIKEIDTVIEKVKVSKIKLTAAVNAIEEVKKLVD
jgi:hypothetical protein